MKKYLYLLYALAFGAPVITTDQLFLAASPGNCSVSSVPTAANYSGIKYNGGTQTRLRIANGGGMHPKSTLFW